MEFPTIDKFAKEVAEKALDEITYEGKTVREWMEIIVKQQVGEDCIERGQAKKFLYEEIERLHDDGLYDCFSKIIDDMYNELPSVTPQRPKGKWKRIAGFEDCNYDKCSICGVYQLFYYGKPSTNYCPNCGAEMSGGRER